MSTINSDILKSLKTNIIKRPQIRKKKKLEFGAFKQMTKDEKQKVILQTIGERLSKKKRKNMTKKEAASIITKWAKAWLEQRKIH